VLIWPSNEKRLHKSEIRLLSPGSMRPYGTVGRLSQPGWVMRDVIAVNPCTQSFSPADMTYVSDTPLPSKCYGPGQWDAVTKKCTLGWVFLLPIDEAGKSIGLDSTMRTKDLSKTSNAADVPAVI
jgi:hypothetical protein